MKLFLLVFRMSKCTRSKVHQNVHEALKYLLESDDEGLRQFEDENDDQSSFDFKYNDVDGNGLIAINISIHKIDKGFKTVEFFCTGTGTKNNKLDLQCLLILPQVNLIMNHLILRFPTDLWKVILIRSITLIVSRGRCNAGDLLPLNSRPQKRVHNKKEPCCKLCLYITVCNKCFYS